MALPVARHGSGSYLLRLLSADTTLPRAASERLMSFASSNASPSAIGRGTIHEHEEGGRGAGPCQHTPDLVREVRSDPARSTNVSFADKTRASVPASASGENGVSSSRASRICSWRGGRRCDAGYVTRRRAKGGVPCDCSSRTVRFTVTVNSVWERDDLALSVLAATTLLRAPISINASTSCTSAASTQAAGNITC